MQKFRQTTKAILVVAIALLVLGHVGETDYRNEQINNGVHHE